MKKRIRIILVVVVAVALGVFYTHSHHHGNKGDLAISGNIEIVDAELSFRIPGRMEARLVSEGETVKAGQDIAKLDQADLLLEVSMRKAEQAAAAAALTELETGYRPEEIAQAQAAADLAGAEEKRLLADRVRQKELFDKKVIAQREFDIADTACVSAQARTREAEARLTLMKKGPRTEQIDAARARLEQAKQAHALAELRLSYATLKAPFAGLVLSHHVEAGEYVVPGTAIVNVGDIEHAWLRGYINETELGLVKAGQKANITTDTYPGKVYQGTVSFISSEAEFTPKNVQTTKERTKLVYRIKIDIPNPSMELKPGMPADAVILCGQ